MYVRGDGGLCTMLLRREGLVVSLMSELDKERVNLSTSLRLKVITPPLRIYCIIYNCRRWSCDLAWHLRTACFHRIEAQRLL